MSTSRLEINGTRVGEVLINGRRYTGKSISIVGDNIVVDGTALHDPLADGPVSVVVAFPCESIRVRSGEVSVIGDVQSVNCAAGEVEITGDVSGDVYTGSGSVRCRDVGGLVKSGSGSISVRRTKGRR